MQKFVHLKDAWFKRKQGNSINCTSRNQVKRDQFSEAQTTWEVLKIVGDNQ